ncbi:hypothetical protein [Clostridium kluyveri]|uniref:hypothetical protein n=1 Tax=Clostridium kluyveri TaxID=1534 RepID=UPI0022454D1F|nr:hypothetical protein [Clostridium kluyveri]UZQ49814.1 hypothetical protein OP486_17985 [Clostridium kluyveri]
MLNVIIPEDNAKLNKQIEALEWQQLKHDTSPKDKAIHQTAYNRLVQERERRKKLYFGINQNSEFLKQLENLVYNWDLSIKDGLEELRGHYIAMWELAQSALKELTGQDFYFSRTDAYFGICNSDNEFLIKENRG